eukprot:TRINITY_DN8534_c0_g2_i1.p1 TRINITY_DN8534_c0_g2~~TRINITY_DN8534_c0_g2_i1.p1  ORF type:complete len:548 (-),score=24.48 TRINITY_DN8534_c0_g2_i1:157-1800(-)
MSDTGDAVVALCASLILCTALLVGAYRCVCALGRSKICSCSPISILRRSLKAALFFGADEPVDAIEAYALAVLQRDQDTCARSTCFLWAILLSGLSVVHNTWLFQQADGGYFFTQAQHAGLCVGAGASVLLWIFWSGNMLATGKLARVSFAGIWLVLDVFMLYSRESRFDIECAAIYGILLGCTCLFTRMDTNVAAFWIALFVIVAVVKHALAEPTTFASETMEMTPIQFTVVTVFAWVWLICVADQINTKAHESAVNEGRTKQSTIEQGALGKLLESACDVVVPVNESLSIMEDAKPFSALLMHDVSRSVQGQSILDYVATEQDQERLQNSLRAMIAAVEPLVSALNLRLRDSRGNAISVECMSVAFRSLNDSPKYLIGLREFPDFLPQPIRELQPATVNPAAGADNQRTRKRRSSRQGSAATLLGQPIGNDEADAANSSSASSCSHAKCGHRHLVLPTWNETSDVGKFASLFRLIQSWNCKLPPGCCSVHRTIPEVKQVLERISTIECDNQLHSARSQCTSCGLLNSLNEDLECLVCRRSESVRL